MSKITAVVGIVTILVLGFIFFSDKQTAPNTDLSEGNSLQQKAEPTQTSIVEKQASFAIFTNGTFRIFTAPMYHNLSQDAYIEASNPNTVLVKKADITWNEFFSTLPFKLTSKCLTTGTKETFCTGNGGTLQFYLNGEKNDNALNQEIKDGDELLVTFGTESQDTIKQQLDKFPK